MPKIQHAKRAFRRAALARKKKRARKLYPCDTKTRFANHLAVCSCPVCGNPRRHFGNSHTRQLSELRNFDQMHDGLQDYFESESLSSD